MRTRLIALAAVFVSSLPVSQAYAIIFPDPITFRDYVLEPIVVKLINVFNDQGQQTATQTSGLTGTIRLGPRTGPDITGQPEGDLRAAPNINIFGADIIDYDISVPFIYDSQGNTQNLDFTPQNSVIEILAPVLETDGNTININFTDPAIGIGTAGINLIREFDPVNPNDDIAFPNGRRFGDDSTDLILASLLKGSVNFGSVFVDDGTVQVVAQGELSPGDTLSIASAEAGVAPVPVPATLGLLVGALSLLGLSRLRRRPARR